MSAEIPRVRPTRAEVDLDALARNLSVLAEAASGARVIALVKADAYGHGAVPVAARLEAEGVDALAVALVEEGLELRAAGIRVPILVLDAVYDGAHRDVLDACLTPVLSEPADLEAFARVAEGPFVFQLELDTGMTRLGLGPEQLGAFLDAMERAPHARLEALMTHLSDAEEDEHGTARQLAEFESARAAFVARGHRGFSLHAANSAGVLLRPRSHLDWVRPGVSLYGVRPRPDAGRALEPVMKLSTVVQRVRGGPAGTAVGYGRTWVAARTSLIATLAIGYGDGLPRALGSRGEVLIRGQRCPLVGRVSMDLTGVDVTDVPGVSRGDEAVLIGAQGEARIRAEEQAAQVGTIAYELLTGISPRVPRVYVEVAAPRAGP